MPIYRENQPTADILMTSMRSMGYSFESAIADIIDNSISANATKIELKYPADPSEAFNKKGKYYNQLIFIKDAGRVEEDGWSFYFKHKKDWEDALPESLTDAIYTFYLANAIRDIRGHLSSHRSMLINISRFVRVQYYIKDKVSEIHDAAYRAVKFNLNPNDFENSMKDPIINRIYNNWVKHYSNVEFIAWEDIAKVLFNAIKEIQIKVVNSTQKNDKLVYTDDSPIRVIAIGGLALSRGLTLEGLLTSYFFRNTATYDEYNTYYDSFVYEISSFHRYLVNDDFPKLTRKQINKAISSASYVLSMPEIAPFEIKEK